MNKLYNICIIAAMALVSAGCGKTTEAGQNDENAKFFDAWAMVTIPGATQTALGSYVIEQTDGDGALIADSTFIRCNYTVRALDGTIQTTSVAKVAQQLGTYNKSKFYGPEVWTRAGNSLYAGIEELIDGKHIGMKIKAAVPRWLITTDRHNSAQEYKDKVAGSEDKIYEFEVVNAFNDINRFELDSVIRVLSRKYPGVDPSDTVDNERTRYGQYYVMQRASDAPDSVYENEARVYINYVGRLLDGTVFDTNVERVAKDAGLYKKDGKYSPMVIKWSNEDYKHLTMSSSESSESNSVIDGFAYALYKMKPHEKGTAIFISKYGYGYNGSGNIIPAYSPLIFELEIVDSNE